MYVMERCGKLVVKKAVNLVIVAVIITVFITSTGCKRQISKTVAAAKPEPVKQVVEAFGIVKARDYKDINLDFPAQIQKVPVKNGQHVIMGEPLIYLNINNFLAMIKNKENELNSARFELLKTRKNLADAEEIYDRAKSRLADKEQLFQKGVISKQELDDFRDQVKVKEKVVTDIKLSFGQSAEVTNIGVQSEKVSVLEYDLNRMKDKLNQSFLQGNIIVSDYSNAVVYDVNCAAGYSVGTSDEYGNAQQKLLSIMDLGSLYISAAVAEEFIKDVRIGAAVTILPVADNTRKYHGEIIRIADMAVKENGETNVAVEISLDNPDGFLRPNFNVDVEIAK
jgi:HlyD family secretion protein